MKDYTFYPQIDIQSPILPDHHPFTKSLRTLIMKSWSDLLSALIGHKGGRYGSLIPRGVELLAWNGVKKRAVRHGRKFCWCIEHDILRESLCLSGLTNSCDKHRLLITL